MSTKRTYYELMPYAAWMALMLSLGATAGTYALRSAVTCALLVFLPGLKSKMREGFSLNSCILGTVAGLAVWLLWVLPEKFDWYSKFFIIGTTAASSPSPYDPAVCGWPLTLAKLAGSAFVIPAAEELFFRSWLYKWISGKTAAPGEKIDWIAFFWTVALFSIEHNRYLAGACAGIIYGVIALKKGLFPAILAHSITNLVLAIQVISTSEWQYW